MSDFSLRAGNNYTPAHPHLITCFFLHLFHDGDDDDDHHCHFQTLRAHGCTTACLFLLKGHILFNLLRHIFSSRLVCSLIQADLFLCVFHITYLIIDLSVLIFVSTRFSYFPCFALLRYFIKHFPLNRYKSYYFISVVFL